MPDSPAFYEERIRLLEDEERKARGAAALLQDENHRLREALKAMTEVASVAHNGDPWYCQQEGVDAALAFRLTSEVLGEAV